MQLFLDHNSLKLIISKLPYDVFSLHLVCKQWNNFLTQDDNLWRMLCIERWSTLRLLPSITLPQNQEKEHLCDMNNLLLRLKKVDDGCKSEDDMKDTFREIARLPDNPLTPMSWKHLFQQRHNQSLFFSKEIVRSTRQFRVSRTAEHMNELLYWNERLRQTHGIQGYWGVTVGKEQIQFVIDSLIYVYVHKKIVPETESTSKVIYGTLMTLNGETVTFIATEHSTDDHSSHCLSVGKFSISRGYPENSEDVNRFKHWLIQVRELLGVNITPSEVWDLIKIIMVPVMMYDAQPVFRDENYWGLPEDDMDLSEDEGPSNARKRKEWFKF